MDTVFVEQNFWIAYACQTSDISREIRSLQSINVLLMALGSEMCAKHWLHGREGTFSRVRSCSSLWSAQLTHQYIQHNVIWFVCFSYPHIQMYDRLLLGLSWIVRYIRQANIQGHGVIEIGNTGNMYSIVTYE